MYLFAFDAGIFSNTTSFLNILKLNIVSHPSPIFTEKYNWPPSLQSGTSGIDSKSP